MEKRKTFIFYLIWITILFYFMWRRLHLGVDLTDETVYATWAYRVFRGDIPILQTREPQLLGSLIMVPFMKIFTLFNKSYDGIIYFMRILYWIFIIGESLVIGHILSRRFSNKLAYFSALPLAFSSFVSIFNFSYNTVSFICINIAFFSCFAIKFPVNKRDECYIILSGVMHSLAAFSYPPLIILCVLDIAFFYIYFVKSEGRKLAKRSILIFIFSGLLTVFIIIVSFILWSKGNVNGLVEGAISILNSPYRKTSIPFYKIIKDAIWGDIHGFIVTPLFLLISGIFVLDIIKRKNTSKTLTVINYFLHILLCFTFIVNITDKGIYGLNRLYVSILLLTIYKIFKSPDKRIRTPILYTLILPYLALVFLRTFTSNNNSLFLQTYAALPLVVLVPFILDFKAKNRTNNQTIIVLTLSTIFLCSSYMYIYRDENVSNLKIKIDKGIYKNLYTTQNRKDDIEHLEIVISNQLNSEATLMVANHFPAIYLMSGMQPLTPDVWDSFYGSQGYTDAGNVFEYFNAIGKSPDTIVFVDYEGNNYHYNDPKYVLNKYIYSHYTLKFIDKSEFAYKIIIFEKDPANNWRME